MTVGQAPTVEDVTTQRTIAVTGGSGLIGSQLLQDLARSEREVRVLTRRGGEAAASQVLVQGDLANGEALSRLVESADAVVHLAGMAHTRLSNQAEMDAFAVNVEGTQALVAAARAAGVRHFLFLSSAHVYSGQRGENLTEVSAVSSASPYAAMKLQAEEAVLAVSGPTFSVTILRPCLVYGPGVRHNLRSLLRALHGGYYVHQAGAKTLRGLVSVDTVSAAIQHLLRVRAQGIYNTADREPAVLEQWVDHLAEIMGVRRPRSLPASLLSAVASLGSLSASLGFPAPLTRDSLGKLTQPFWLSVDKLAGTGFRWPATAEHVLRQMVEAEIGLERSA